MKKIYETSYGVSGKQLIRSDRCKTVVREERKFIIDPEGAT